MRWRNSAQVLMKCNGGGCRNSPQRMQTALYAAVKWGVSRPRLLSTAYSVPHCRHRAPCCGICGASLGRLLQVADDGAAFTVVLTAGILPLLDGSASNSRVNGQQVSIALHIRKHLAGPLMNTAGGRLALPRVMSDGASKDNLRIGIHSLISDQWMDGRISRKHASFQLLHALDLAPPHARWPYEIGGLLRQLHHSCAVVSQSRLKREDLANCQ